jgi:predicted metal-dependent peptidase
MISLEAAEAAGVMAIAVKRMTRSYPFHAHLLSVARVEEDADIETMAVTVRAGKVTFLYSPAFVLGLNLDEIGAVLHHEVLHVVFGHLFAKREDFPDRTARMIAEEVTVNEWVPEKLPGEPILLKDFPALPPMEDTDTRYQRLAKKRSAAPDLDSLDDHDVWQEARASGRLGEAVVMSAVRRAVAMLTPEEMERIPAGLLDAIHDAARGAAAGRSVEKLGAAGTPTVPWQTLLRRFVCRATDRAPSYLRPPRRFPDLVGIVPGSARHMSKPRIMAVIDTSGSMTAELLALIAGELRSMSRVREVVVVECDAAIQRTYPFKGELGEVHGRGGTDFRPPLEPAVLAKIRPDIVVYFTDGEGPAPARAPRVPVLWCLTPGASSPVPWARCIWMK